jgi:methylated-DNA-[protein]-cysteine S-methyltransferase
MITTYTAFFKSPIGLIKIVTTEKRILRLDIVKKITKSTKIPPPLLKSCISQLDEYFCGKRQEFDLPLKLEGTDFQKRVWNELIRIPYGKVFSYKEIAQKVGSPKAFRAVGNANSKNKLPILIPCHRVIAANGKLGGYGLGLKEKKLLLDLESHP